MAAEKPTSIARYYKGWGDYQRQLVVAFTPLEDAHLKLQAAPGLWSIGMLGNHIVATRAWWFHFWMDEGGDEFEEFAWYCENDSPCGCVCAKVGPRSASTLP